MAWIEVYGGQRSLAFKLTTATNQSNRDSLIVFLPYSLDPEHWSNQELSPGLSLSLLFNALN